MKRMEAPRKNAPITVRIPGGSPRRLSPRPLVIPIFIPHRGCPHRCSFCNQSVITGSSDAGAGTVSVADRVDRFLSHSASDRHPVEIAFFGGNFLGLPRREVESLLGKAAAAVDAGVVDGIRFSTRPDTVTETTMEWIQPYPVRTIEIGAQSMVDRVLNLSCRGHCEKDTRMATRRLQKETYAVGLQIMTGLPGETEADALATGRAVTNLAPDFVRIYPTVVVEGSPLARLYGRGAYRPLSLEEAVTRTKKLFLLFQSACIPVIRMGLHVTSDPDMTGAVLAGPIHPAFGHLVLSEILLDHVTRELEHHPVAGTRLTLRAHPSNLSRLQGQNCRNLASLRQKFHLRSAEAIADSSLEKDEILISLGE